MSYGNEARLVEAHERQADALSKIARALTTIAERMPDASYTVTQTDNKEEGE